MKAIVFYLGVGSLFAHELDAIPNHEWRVLPLISALPDGIAMHLFIAAHVPLFAILVALIASENPKIRKNSRVAVTALLIIHGLLHALFMGRPEYEFSSVVSNVLIFGGGVLGGLFLILEMAPNLFSRRE